MKESGMFPIKKSANSFVAKAGPVSFFVVRYDGVTHLALIAGKFTCGISNQWYVFKRDNFLYRWTRFKTAIIPWPIYYVNDSRDCDHYRVVSACRARNGWQYLRDCDSIYEGAEGPEHIWRVTKAEYESHKETRRDYMAEAFEDGHPYSPDY